MLTKAFWACSNCFGFLSLPNSLSLLAWRVPIRILRRDFRNASISIRSVAELGAVYMPARVFGSTPRSGLTFAGRNILIALTEEVTRSKRSQRQDKRNNSGRGQGQGRQFTCFQLPVPRERFTLRTVQRQWPLKTPSSPSAGYHLVGKTGKGWMYRAGFIDSDPDNNPGKPIRRFLVELRSLTGPFSLVAAGWHLQKRAVYSLKT